MTVVYTEHIKNNFIGKILEYFPIAGSNINEPGYSLVLILDLIKITENISCTLQIYSIQDNKIKTIMLSPKMIESIIDCGTYTFFHGALYKILT